MQTIDSHTLDDVLLAPLSRSDEIRRLLTARAISTIGPAVEYALQQPRFPKVLPAMELLRETPVTAALQAVICGAKEPRSLSDTSLKPLRAEFAMLRSRASDAQGPGWIAYLKRLQGAATQAGFGDSTAAGLVGAVKELVDNIDIHSEAPNTGIVGYSYSERQFEFVLADAGIGVLESLRSNPNYSQLSDHGDALLTALTDGESRFGRDTNHGWGFRQIFVALADLHGMLRFRSGDHRLEIDGDGPTLPAGQIAQTSIYQGFIASLTCRPPN